MRASEHLLPFSALEFHGELSHWCLLDLSCLHIHKVMEKMDMPWCSILSNLIYFSISPPPHTQAFPAGSEGDGEQGSSTQAFASHCMSAFCTTARCDMSNDASLSLTYGNSVTYANGFIVLFWDWAGCVSPCSPQAAEVWYGYSPLLCSYWNRKVHKMTVCNKYILGVSFVFILLVLHCKCNNIKNRDLDIHWRFN